MCISCIGEPAIFAYLGGLLPRAELETVEVHLADCAACCALVAETCKLLEEQKGGSLGDMDPRRGPEVAPHVSGARVGRYEIVEPIGAGGMGVVYRAHDTELRRDVAIKLVRPEVSATRGPQEAKARILREARAMARISHPNVVAIFDVGEADDEVFVAMELVEGETLRAWLAAAPRTWREVVRVFLAAGEGLAAAHAVGLIHRDFKPENVLLGNDGRVRVTDFGLARGVEGPEEAQVASSHGDCLGEDAETLTATYARLGTPAYMSPEQIVGGPIDARTDQFSLCVSLYEALHGRRPFDAPRRPPPGDAVDLSALPTTASPTVPDDVCAVVIRGLSCTPDDRFPTLRALLRALEAAGRLPARRAGADSPNGLARRPSTPPTVAPVPRQGEACPVASTLAQHTEPRRGASPHMVRKVTVAYEPDRGGVPPVTFVRSTLLHASQMSLRDIGHFDEYARHVAPAFLAATQENLAATWLPADVALAHYRACDALGLSAGTCVQLGQSVSHIAQGTFASTVLRLAREAGASPWSLFSNRLWERVWRGSALGIMQTGPKDVEIEILRNDCTVIPYFRSAFRGIMGGLLGLVCKRVVCREIGVSGDGEGFRFHVMWV